MEKEEKDKTKNKKNKNKKRKRKTPPPSSPPEGFSDCQDIRGGGKGGKKGYDIIEDFWEGSGIYV
ncbi:hypothetical protein E2C01_024058 [Portunus trituberculatus]|uniref:Uncharacterized protein n=1 Tax=Portunus trituberculatus TaxID=210409 RepID=A0A5B7EBN8_PORTR|nr:hypothetical protein [Portunus trituberculatus]